MTIVERAKEAWNSLTKPTDTSGKKPGGHPVSLKSTTTTTTPKRYIPMKSYLKVKIKSLAEEATIIRHEERRVKRTITWWQDNVVCAPEGASEVEGLNTISTDNYESTISSYRNEYFGLHHHRTYEVRNESRASQLAYAYIQGYAYTRVEDPAKTRKPVPTFRVAELALKYGKVDLPPTTPYNKRRDEAEKIIRAWSEVAPT